MQTGARLDIQMRDVYTDGYTFKLSSLARDISTIGNMPYYGEN